MTDEQHLRVVVADDSYLVREALGHLLDSDPRVDLVATCQDGDELAETVDAELPDVVVTDIRMPPSGDDEGIAFANRLRETHPEIGVVVSASTPTRATGWRCWSAGPTGAPICSRIACATAST